MVSAMPPAQTPSWPRWPPQTIMVTSVASQWVVPILNWGSLSFKTFGDLHKCISWIVNVVRSVTSLHPSSVLRGTITILCMIVAVTGAHGVVTYILVHKSTIRNCWTGWRGGIILHPLCTSVDGSHLGCSSTPKKMIILRYHEVFFRLAAPTAMPAHLGAYSLEKTSWYCNIIILLGVEEHPN